MKRVWSIGIALMICLFLVGCGRAGGDQEVTNAYAKEKVGFQMEKPEKGDTVAILKTNKGDISIRLFPEAAPKAVQNFTTLAEEGYYDGLTFHRVIEGFMIQGGDPKGDGTGGTSCWENKFEDEFDKKLLNIRGSLAMANSGPDTNGSQFFINQGDGEDFGTRDKYYLSDAELNEMKVSLTAQYEQLVAQYGKDTVRAYYGSLEDLIEAYMPVYDYDLIPKEVWELYEEVGGNITLDGAWRQKGGHTVFGHVYEGMDIVDTIAAVETDDNDKPKESVIINSIDIIEYAG